MRTKLGDFTTNPRRLAIISLFAALIGLAAACVAKLLLLLIGLVTHLAYFGRPGAGLVPPDPRHFGLISIAIPVIGGLIVGVIARFGSEKIRGHGIPEAIQSILDRDSIIQARVALWKPLASAITIGTGAPFGAEGPIIMTGGAVGSLFAQFLRLSSLERRTLLVAGAAGGMAATFGAPIASVLIAVELLLFEWRPRSFIPVAVAAFVAEAMRTVLIGSNPPFLMLHAHLLPTSALGWALVVGICGGIVSAIMTKLVYFTEDAYEKLPIHWMWWPAIGGLVVGIGGWFVPQALGVGYPTIAAMLNGQLALSVVAGIIVVKIIIWIVALGSGTSGGVLAPLLMIGGAMGTLLAVLIPGHDSAAWAAIGMAAIMGGTMRAPFMATLFAVETTHGWGLLPALFVACVAATAFTVVFVPRSILTEKLARRGMHVAREYAVHPLELISIGATMRSRDTLPSFAGGVTIGEAAAQLLERDATGTYAEYPVVEADVPVATVSRNDLIRLARDQSQAPVALRDVAKPAVLMHPEDRMREAANIMARRGVRSVFVMDERGRWVGVLTSDDLLRAWKRGMASEDRRVRVRSIRRLMGPIARRPRSKTVS
ncbi:MAG TPA: chloride channel protein [Candidatus Baltobacteraceae bacterium]